MADEHWKDRVGFISGNAIVWGVVLISLWPVVARFQTGTHLHAWSIVWPSEGAKPGFVLHGVLTIVLALGMGSVFFALAHLFVRGVWMGITPHSRDGEEDWLHAFLDRTALRLYAGVFITWLCAFGFLVFGVVGLVADGVEAALPSLLGMSNAIARFVSVLLVFGIAVALVVFGMMRWGDKIPDLPDYVAKARVVTYAPPILVFFLAGITAHEMCYTCDLKVDQDVVSQSKGGEVRVTMELGGATSDVGDLELELRDAQGYLRRVLRPLALGAGEHVAFLHPARLARERYEVRATYPHPAFHASFPFVRGTIVRSRWIAVRE